MSDAAPLPAAAWYPDQSVPDQLRWWDGAAWTHHIAPAIPTEPAVELVPTTEPEPAPEHPVGRAAEPPKDGTIGRWANWLLTPQRRGAEDEWRYAETSFFLAVLSLVNFSALIGLVGAIVAIIFGMRGMHLAWLNRYPLGAILGLLGILIALRSLGLL